ncbi:hypothetical protein DMN50_18770 [Priestia megaterium]|nr:hypothetical protein CS527_04435 [Bacillus sp. Y-01]MDR4219309.1 hypothetical protein [Priestia megaterium]QCR26082.1 hypothetical protein C1N54_04260 [Priestia megaterium]QDZ83621.1 hypothetical protein D0441_03995 [Priestia megaterium]RBN39740.1 hypothetical protein DMN50_18770 [Priestia megaterium]
MPSNQQLEGPAHTKPTFTMTIKNTNYLFLIDRSCLTLAKHFSHILFLSICYFLAHFVMPLISSGVVRQHPPIN